MKQKHHNTIDLASLRFVGIVFAVCLVGIMCVLVVVVFCFLFYFCFCYAALLMVASVTSADDISRY